MVNFIKKKKLRIIQTTPLFSQTKQALVRDDYEKTCICIDCKGLLAGGQKAEYWIMRTISVVQFCYDDGLGPGGDKFECNNDTWGQSVSFEGKLLQMYFQDLFFWASNNVFLDISAAPPPTCFVWKSSAQTIKWDNK